MAIGRENTVSHEYEFGMCQSCRQRGINNKSEVRFFQGTQMCGTCIAYHKGELEEDNLALKLYVNGKPPVENGTSKPKEAVMPEPVVPEVTRIPESEEIASYLYDVMDDELKKEILEAIESDKDIVVSILTNPILFSLKELKKQATRLKEIENVSLKIEKEAQQDSLEALLTGKTWSEPSTHIVEDAKPKKRRARKKPRRKKKIVSVRSPLEATDITKEI